MQPLLSRTAQATLALTLVFGSGALAQSPPTPEPTAAAAQASQLKLRPATGRRANVVEREEIAGLEVPTALEAVRRLRPEFLSRRAVPRPGEAGEDAYAVVYLDGARLGGWQMLQTIPLAVVTRIRYLRASEAADWVGREHRGGVIAVSTSR